MGRPFANDPKGKGRRLIPVRVQEVDVEGLLGQIVYIDLVGKDEKAAKAELLGKLRGTAVSRCGSQSSRLGNEQHFLALDQTAALKHA